MLEAWSPSRRGGEQVIERLIDGEKIELGSHISRKSCTEISRVGTHRRARNSGAQADSRPYPQYRPRRWQ